ncbi:MAG TPA: PilZ domain-containing protein [Terriglobales bacterium]|nr:PilZ domain-containing protein [Terriglobales bacterium]
MVARVCRELGVELQPCSTAKAALEKFTLQRFHAVIVDDQDGRSAASLLSDIQARTSGRKALIVALAQTDAPLDAVFGAGTHLVIYKPLTHDRLRNGLRAIRILMGRRQQRSSPRIKLNITASLTLNETEKFSAKLLDISEGGAALSLQRPFPSVKPLNLSFSLPGEQDTITTAAELVWKDIRGNLGIEFVNNDPAFSVLVARWMKARSLGRPVGTPQDFDLRGSVRRR